MLTDAGTAPAQGPAEAFGAVMGAAGNIGGCPVLGVIVRHRVADLIGESALSAEEIASRAGLNALSLTRALRFLAAFGIFRETEPGWFENTLASSLLADKPGGLRNYVFMVTSDAFMGAMARLAHGIRSGEPPFAHVNGEGFWQYLVSRPEENSAFNAMFAELRGGQHIAIAESYDWSGASAVVDVGGGNGSLLATILERQKSLRGVLVDQPHVLSSAKGHLEARGVASRCDLVAGDFFEAVSARGDVWMLSQILHDWNDDDCLRILGNCRSAMRAGDRLLVIEMVTIPCRPDPIIGIADMMMLALFGNARQRTEPEYRGLFAASGLELTRVIPTANAFSLVEAKPR